MANLFKDAADLETVLPQVHASADDVMIYVSNAADLYMVDFLSQEFYNELVAALDGVDYVIDDLTAAQQAIINHLRTASAYYGMYVALPFINVHIANTGAMSHQGEGSAGLRLWEYNKAQQQAITNGDLFMDKALKVMEATPASYATWAASDAFTERKKYLITNADDFASKGLLNISGSRRTYLRLVPYIAKAEQKYVVPCIGTTIFNDIKAKLAAGDALEAYQTTLLESYIYPATAHYAMYMGAPELNVDITKNGIKVVSTDDGVVGSKPDEKAYMEWRMQILGDAKDFLSNGKKYLDDNKDTISDYDSDDASDNDTPQYNVRDNSGSKSSVML